MPTTLTYIVAATNSPEARAARDGVWAELGLGDAPEGNYVSVYVGEGGYDPDPIRAALEEALAPFTGTVDDKPEAAVATVSYNDLAAWQAANVVQDEKQ